MDPLRGTLVYITFIVVIANLWLIRRVLRKLSEIERYLKNQTPDRRPA